MYTVGKNITLVIFGQISSLIINFLAITFAARLLGVETFGKFNYLVAYIGIISKVFDFGLSPIILREYSKDYSNIGVLNNGLMLRILGVILTFLLLNLSLFVFSCSYLEFILLNILLMNIIFSSKILFVREILEIPFKANLRMTVPVLVMLFDNIFLLILIYMLPMFGVTLTKLVVVFVIANIPGFLFIAAKSFRTFKFRFNFDKNQIFWLLKEAFPIYIYIAFTTVYQQIDIVYLEKFDSSYSTGIYSSASRLTTPLNIIPSSLVIALFPIIVRNINLNPLQNIKIIQVVLKILFVIAVCFSLVFYFKSEFIIRLIYGNEFAKASVPTSILLFTQIFVFLSFFLLDIITAYNKQKYNFVYAFIVLIIDVIMLYLFTPQYSFYGASFAKAISFALGFVFICIALRKIGVHFNFLSFRLFIFLIIFTVILILISKIDLSYYLIISILSASLLIIILRVITISELMFILKLSNK